MKTEKMTMLANTFTQFGINNEASTSEDAVILLKNAAGEERVNEDFELTNGDYGLMATTFDVLTTDEFKKIKDFLFKCRIKSLLIGFDHKARVKPAVIGRKKTDLCIMEPSQVIWEFSGVTYESARLICDKVSEIIGHELRIVYRPNFL